ncbi:MAG: hypothetical protein U5K76_03670 [Woeseiaceae bacterium]|nr:hypothetical protein [Woeseiaceae bacterium]
MSDKLLKACTATLLAAFALGAGLAQAQNHAPNPYRTVEGWAKLPSGREWGATSAVFPANDGEHIWVAERCARQPVRRQHAGPGHPVRQGRQRGTAVRCRPDRLAARHLRRRRWQRLDARTPVGYAPVPDGVGHTVMKFSPDGELLMTLGKEGVAGTGEDTFTKPSDVLVAPNGDIFVADGHDASGNNRIVKFDKNGNFLGQWGTTGDNDGQFRDPHALAMDSPGPPVRGRPRRQPYRRSSARAASTLRPGRSSAGESAFS